MDNVILMNADEVKKFGIRVKYVLLECVECSHSWGKAFYGDNQTLELKDLVCQKCALNHVVNNFQK